MIYEVRTYNVKPGSLAEVEKRFGEAYEKRKELSPLAAFFHTEIGPLNQIIHIWPYKDLAEREQIRDEAVKRGIWPPKIGEFLQEQQTDIFKPLAISPEMKPGNLGPYFEMRTYTLPAGEVPLLLENWAIAMPRRLTFSPVCAVWYTELGGLHKWSHIWPYESLNARGEVRAKVAAAQAWPPSAIAKKEGRKPESFLEQENKILLPAKFSPIQ